MNILDVARIVKELNKKGHYIDMEHGLDYKLLNTC